MGKTASREMALPPFAGLETLIPFRREKKPGQSRRVAHECVHALAASDKFLRVSRAPSFDRGREGRIIGNDAVLVRIFAGEDRREARAAKARRHISARKNETLRREPIEVRR